MVICCKNLLKINRPIIRPAVNLHQNKVQQNDCQCYLVQYYQIIQAIIVS